MTIVNHIGLAVSDLDRSRRFYEEVLGFTCKNEITVPDAVTAKLMDVPSPSNMRAAYMVTEGLVLELLTYDTVLPTRPRPLNEPGLTHISICVDDIAATIAAAVAHGGESLKARDFPGMVAMIRDPDGQVIELLPMGYRDSL